MKSSSSTKKRIIVIISITLLMIAGVVAFLAANDTSKFEITPSVFAQRFNRGVAGLDSETYENMTIQSISTTESDIFMFNHASKEHYLYSENANAQIRGDLYYRGNIACLRIKLQPFGDAEPFSAEYCEEWTNIAALSITSLFQDISDSSARKILKDSIGLPIFEDGEVAAPEDDQLEILAEGTSKIINMDGFKVKFYGSMEKNGIITIKILLPFKTDDDVIIATSQDSRDLKPNERPTVLKPDETATIKLGKQFVIRLEANSGREHKWEYTSSGDGESSLDGVWLYSATGELGDEPYKSSMLDKNKSETQYGNTASGGSQKDEWTFTATKTGTQTLTFEYWYPWNGKRVITKVVTFTVNIER